MFEREVSMFQVLSDPTRIQLLQLLIEGETCGCTLIDKFEVSQPTLSYHLNLIAKAGLARKERDGNRFKYFVNRDQITHLQSFLQHIIDSEASQCEVN